MLTASDSDGRKICIDDYVKKSCTVYCPLGHEMVAKQGEVMKWHFAHKTDSNCIYSKGKTKWHLWWQSRIKTEYLEARMLVNDTLHIADIYNKHSEVIEVQHSIMDKQTMHEREEFYGDMIWIFDVSGHSIDIVDKHKDLVKMVFRSGNMYFSQACKKSYLDMGYKGLFEVLKNKGKTYVCRKIPLNVFDTRYFDGIMVDGADIRKDMPYFDMSKGKATDAEVKLYKM